MKMNRIKKWTELVPKAYQAEYADDLKNQIRIRTQLLCVLTISLYLAGSLLSYLFIPDTFRPEEIGFIMLIVASAALILFLSGRTATLTSAKANVFFFIVVMLFILTKSNLLYPHYFYFSSSVYLFVLFLLSFTIPWVPLEILPITIMVMGSYSVLYFIIRKGSPEALIPDVAIYDYISGLILLLLGGVLSSTVRRKDMLREIQNFNYFKQIQEKQQQMTGELELATRVHRTLIPRSFTHKLVDVAITYLPMNYIGGDYAKFHFIDGKKLVFMICDVTGHGVSAALLVNRIHTEFERLTREHTTPGELLDKLNEFIISDFGGTEMYLSAFCGMLDFGSMKLFYSNHGHPPQYLYRMNSSGILPLPSQEPILGVQVSDSKGVQSELDFTEGDKLILFTDGVTENRSASGEEFGTDRLEDFISARHSLKAADFSKTLAEELKRFNNNTLSDDILILTLDLKKHKGWL
jgi:serine phosphatase RsbU (regulator of sigma subunit)